jgi:hypothetical protein
MPQECLSDHGNKALIDIFTKLYFHFLIVPSKDVIKAIASQKAFKDRIEAFVIECQIELNAP